MSNFSAKSYPLYVKLLYTKTIELRILLEFISIKWPSRILILIIFLSKVTPLI